MTDRRLAAAAAAFLAVALFSGVDALVKAAGVGLPLAMIVFLRYLFGTLLAGAGAAVGGNFRIEAATVRHAAVRAVATIVTASLFFASLKLVPLAQAVALTFTSPFFMVLISAVLIGDRVTRRSVIAMTVGFAGVLVILAERLSGGAGSTAGLLMALGSSVAYALSMVLARRDAARDPVAQMILLQNGMVAAMALPFALIWPAPVDMTILGRFLVIAGFGTLGHYAMTWAYKHAPATLLGPFEFTALLWAVTFGIVFFAELPSPQTLLGAAIIIAACLAVLAPGRRAETEGA